MNDRVKHPSERDLLLAADGELSRRRMRAIDVHLRSCWSCRALMQNIEHTIATFVSVRDAAAEKYLPPKGSAHARLAARLRMESMLGRTNPSVRAWLHRESRLFWIFSKKVLQIFPPGRNKTARSAKTGFRQG